jgi:triacylglycerol lipase
VGITPDSVYALDVSGDRVVVGRPQSGDLTAPALFAEPIGKATKHPIVLAHGFMGTDSSGTSATNVWSFFGVADALRADGHVVHEARVQPFHAPEVRAKELAKHVDLAIAECRTKPGCDASRVNVVAHSMGGLDARWWVGRLGGHRRVASLTTIATPHHGTYVADWGGLRVGRALSGWRRLAELGVDARAIPDLTRAACAERNAALLGGPEVPTFSYGGARPWWGIAVPLQVAFRVLQRVEGPNDGLVSVASARYGTYLGTLEADHFAETGWHWTPPGITRFDHLAFYRGLVRDLAARGY